MLQGHLRALALLATLPVGSLLAQGAVLTVDDDGGADFNNVPDAIAAAGDGDVLLINNWVTFHRRTAFEDHTEPERRRHLLRLWLSVPNSRPLDPRFAANFGATGAGALRGGMQPASDQDRKPDGR